MSAFSYVPTGFRFHPTDEELVDYYLRKKWASKKIDLDIIKEVDLYKIEPWDLEELCRLGTEDQNEWYFFSHKDKKYPTGTRTNRATKVGFWKATGRDKAIYSKHSLVGMRKTLVYYKGRAPNGQKSDWIMHEYRLETNEHAVPQEEGWVVCRVSRKKLPAMRRTGEYDSLCWFEDQVPFMPDHFDSPRQISHPCATSNFHPSLFKQELQLQHVNASYEQFLQLPPLESPRVPISSASALYGDNNASRSSAFTQENHMYESYPQQITIQRNYSDEVVDHITDWRALDKLVASQLSQEDDSKEISYLNNSAIFPVTQQSNAEVNDSIRPFLGTEYFSTSSSAGQFDLWK